MCDNDGDDDIVHSLGWVQYWFKIIVIIGNLVLYNYYSTEYIHFTGVEYIIVVVV